MKLLNLKKKMNLQNCIEFLYFKQYKQYISLIFVQKIPDRNFQNLLSKSVFYWRPLLILHQITYGSGGFNLVVVTAVTTLIMLTVNGMKWRVRVTKKSIVRVMNHDKVEVESNEMDGETKLNKFN